jgi:hypothetical protein
MEKEGSVECWWEEKNMSVPTKNNTPGFNCTLNTQLMWDVVQHIFSLDMPLVILMRKRRFRQAVCTSFQKMRL